MSASEPRTSGPNEEGSGVRTAAHDRSAPRIRLGIDVGGTFTDVAILDEVDGTVRFDKVSTTPDDPTAGVLAAFEKAAVAPHDIAYFVHGTTLALNALLTRSGVSTALITTRGFRDVYELGRTDREPMYDLFYRKPPRLVPRERVFEVDERMTFDGTVHRPFDRDQARTVADAVQASGAAAVAVCFLHSYANSDHEQAMAEVLAERCPGIEVTLSHRLVREYREYERTSTAVVDAYIKPVVRHYLERLGHALSEAGFGGRFLVTRSGGGAMTASAAVEQPGHLVLSGPASGVIGATAIGALLDEPSLITLDMGGTSLDASLIADGEPSTVNEERFEGETLTLPSLNIRTIGAGGGSIGWVDEAGHLQVGPASAGADPGPACYGRGGTDATITDAALFVGYLGASTALGGELRLSPEAAEAALDRLGAPLGMSAAQTADGMLRIVTTRILGAVREISVDEGHDPADFALLTYGGAGGLVAAIVARELSIPRVVVPPGPGAFSAFGMLLTDVVHDFGQTFVSELGSIAPERFTDLYRSMEVRGAEVLGTEGFAAAETELRRTAELRFAGQEHTVEAAVPSGDLTGPDLAELAERFGQLHLERYGHRMEDPVELVTVRLRAVGHVPRPKLPTVGEGRLTGSVIGHRDIYRGPDEGTVTYAVHWRDHLGRDARVDGPAIVEEHTATTVLHAADVLHVGEHGELTISVATTR